MPAEHDPDRGNTSTSLQTNNGPLRLGSLNEHPPLTRITSMPFAIPSPTLSRHSSNTAELSIASTFGTGEDLALFTSESLHSFSFANQSDETVHTRHSILKRSIDFLREKTGWAGGNKALVAAQAKINGDPEMQNMVDLLSRARVLTASRDAGDGLAHTGPMTGPAQMPNENVFDRSFADQSESPTSILPASGLDGATVVSEEPDDMLTPTQGIIDVTVEPPPETTTRSVTNPPTQPGPGVDTGRGLRRTFTDISPLSLQSKLTDALAQPFVAPESGLLSITASSASLNTPATANFPGHAWHGHARAAPSTQAIFTTEAVEPWTMVAANDLGCLTFGISKAELRKMSILEIFREEKRQWLETKLKASTSSRPLRVIPSSPRSPSSAKLSTSMGGGVTARLLQKPPSRETGQGRPGRPPTDKVPPSSASADSASGSAENRSVVLCGDVLPIRKRNGAVGSVTIWVQEKRGSLIWVLEEVVEDVAILNVDEVGCVVRATGQCEAVFGMERVRRGMDITRLIPGIPRLKGTNTGALDFDEIATLRRFTAHTANDISIPITVDQLSGESSFRVSSFPNIAGMFILSASTLEVTSSNPAISQALFGHVSDGLSISDMIPGFDNLLDHLIEENNIDLIDGVVIPEYSFRRARAMIAIREGKEDAAAIFLRPSGLPAIHRDGAEIMVDVQLRVARTLASTSGTGASPKQDKENGKPSLGPRSSEIVYALWITYSKVLHAVNHGVGPISPLMSRPGTPPHQPSPSDAMSALSDDDGSDPESSASKSSSTSSTQEAHPLPLLPATSKNEPPPKRTINDYVILEDMGAGAYGQVKLARPKPSIAPTPEISATSNKKVVIKYVFKARILVDTWTRDRRLGTVPLEIHVLDYLSKNFAPHPNIITMSGFFEDTVNYYILMVPHGLPGMDLFDYIELRSEMSEDECRDIFVQVVEGVRFLHEDAKVVHRDIKDENVILDGEGRVKIVDFGSASYIKNGPFEVFVGTIGTSPLVLPSQPLVILCSSQDSIHLSLPIFQKTNTNITD